MEQKNREYTRLSRIDYYMKVANVVSERSTCDRAKVGAILVDPTTNKIVATGFNGSAKGTPHCLDVGCLIVEGHCIRTIHAEMNALIHLEKSYEHLELYSTHQPCYNCYKALVTSNVKRMVYINAYPDLRRDLLEKEILTAKDNIPFVSMTKVREQSLMVKYLP